MQIFSNKIIYFVFYVIDNLISSIYVFFKLDLPKKSQ